MNLGNNERNSLLSQYLTVGPLTGYTKDGRKIHEAKCKLCHQIFSNDRSGYKHLRNVHKISFNEHRSNIRKLDEFFDIQSNNFDDNGNNRQILLLSHKKIGISNMQIGDSTSNYWEKGMARVS